MLCKLNQFWRKIVSCWKKFLMFLPLCLCASLVLILPTLVSLLMRHTSQTIVRLDEEGFLWLSFCSFGPWSNSFDLCWTLHALIVISSYILTSCIYLYAYCFWLLILLLCFCFCLSKNPKTHKKWKIQKFDHICLSTFHIWVWLGPKFWKSWYLEL